jgi:CheY-like chemotaxis protein
MNPQRSIPAPAPGGLGPPAGGQDERAAPARSLEIEARYLNARLDARRQTRPPDRMLTTLGRLVPGVAHELANPLTALVIRSGMARMATSLDDARHHIALLEEQAQRAAKILKNLCAFACPRQSGRVPVDLNQVVRTALELYGYQLAATRISVVLDLMPDLPDVEGDQFQLEQVVVNLVLNAEEAMAHSRAPGTLTIHTEADPERVRLSVRNDGPGMSSETASGTVELFLAPPGHEDTGLGLLIVRDVVTDHGGQVAVDTREGTGTTVTVTLPRPPSVRPGPSDTSHAEGAAIGRGSLLVVDDEPDVGELLSDLLRVKGYEAEYVASSTAALDRLRARDFQGVLMDLRMPVMSGTELWQVLQRERPALALKTIFMTGDQARGETAAFLDASAQPCLPKPFRPADLDAALAQIDAAASRE